MKPKDALIKDGFPGVVAGRGRLSSAAKERCKELAAMGWNIEGYSAEKSTTGEITVKTEKPNVSQIISEFTILWPEEDFVAVELVSGKKRSMREACNNCMRSMVQCQCDQIGRIPSIVSTNGVGPVQVRIEKR